MRTNYGNMKKKKRKLQMQGLSDKEYEIAIRKLVKRLGI